MWEVFLNQPSLVFWLLTTYRRLPI